MSAGSPADAMRIGIDGRELLGPRTGAGRVLAALCAEWMQRPAGRHDFLVYYPAAAGGMGALGPPLAGARPDAFHPRPVPGAAGTWWEQIRLPPAANQDALDVFFAPAYSAPLRLTAPSVVTMHDVSFAAHPEWFHWREGLRRRWLADRTMRRARAVITVSEFSRTEIVRWFDVPPDRVRVVRHGIDAAAVRPERRRGRPLVLYVGSIFNRRHLPTLIRAFARVAREVPGAELAIVGADRTWPRQDLASAAADAGVGGRVTLHAYAPEADLAALYRQARVFAFLSEYEGFGLPPLEALAAGVPTVVADTPVAREIYGAAATFVPHHDVPAIAEEIVALLRDDARRAQARGRAAALVRTFSWERAARDTLAVLEQAARGGP